MKRDLDALTRRLDALSAPGPGAVIEAAEQATHDLLCWIRSGFAHLPPEPFEQPGMWLPSRVRALAEAGDAVLVLAACGPLLAQGCHDPAALDFVALRAAQARRDSLEQGTTDPVFGGTAPAGLIRHPALPPLWRRLADEVDALLSKTPAGLGVDPTPPPAFDFL